MPRLLFCFGLLALSMAFLATGARAAAIKTELCSRNTGNRITVTILRADAEHYEVLNEDGEHVVFNRGSFEPCASLRGAPAQIKTELCSRRTGRRIAVTILRIDAEHYEALNEDGENVVFNRGYYEPCEPGALAPVTPPPPSGADPQNVEARRQKRVALLIGNSAYRNAPALANPKNDAQDMAAALKALGFAVILGTDLDKRAMDQKVLEFANALSGAGAGVFHYSGHGLQVASMNYLVPVDASLESAAALDFEAMPLTLVQRTM